MLEVKNLHVYYGGIHALKGIDLRVAEGQIVTLIGANGAGKSTTLRSIAGLVRPRQGSIVFQGTELTTLPTYKVIQLGIGVAPEGRKVFGNLTVLENLELGAYNRPPQEFQADLEWVFSLFPRLEERRKQLAGTLSGGEQQMLALGRALMSRPKLVLLDEPSLGLAPLVVEEVFETITTINQQGATVLLVEQNAMAALHVAHYAYVLETGRITLEGTGRDLLQDERVRKAYLGE
ncbi:amino acid/amide ABC transporter ATP-binding protein 2, HAAT family [Desulfacinum infernum DSM 9756]|jgi:branched-chain amino acid transport system ATP-binding protein|uniref:Amino acid/amide ABC transporter ATP-binding protein 2, HAAT family n=1 Tax=Desulfacinum infernum DSM 9756 TaxID=1121391 RepID=A0A1M4UPP3_9BACT|nr:ABC transporter ATP-binding protein [Desulfacinum infernum]MBC7358888.1 ABC transporter ATP-binding protein [Desulfacinum sp.]MBZ4658370.1 transporter ATP-binding protein [Desulfacinum sp.]SHE58684.1 amino acid/amide ABC transporter ATP-binding protein 2, HAAT family [Desulfacinum infernum DSM 9756]